ncbi:MAG: hypothetical protein K2L60_07395 [Bacteroides sp.]|nr:hypothetical protein [Bacteroides sp.]
MIADNKMIPINRLRDECNRDVHVKWFCQGPDWHYLTELPVHRDDNYLFILLEHGFGFMNVDFKEVHLTDAGLCIVRPGQIHYNIKGRRWPGGC